eukprot:c21660_g1_i4.p1 GENE.c21660_g1_i4~~c21660_g1_i4.p1  ORF type:complete len:204 (-),score=40.89 c21660_g1_i4:142-753(-)
MEPVKSQNITVLSCRLYHQPKFALCQLKPTDSVSKMPGIGRLYAQRFACAGVINISQLAELNIQTMDSDKKQKFLDSIRKERSSLTLTKLNEYIEQAQEIMFRFSEEGSDCVPSPPSKKAKIDSNSDIVRVSSTSTNTDTEPNRDFSDSLIMFHEEDISLVQTDNSIEDQQKSYFYERRKNENIQNTDLLLSWNFDNQFSDLF